MVAVPSIAPGLERGLTSLHDIDVWLLGLKEELCLTTEAKGIVRLFVSVSRVLVINCDVGLVDDLTSVDGMAGFIINVPAQDTEKRVEEFNPERGFAVGRLDVLGAVGSVPLHQSGEIAAPSLDIVLHARRLLLSRYQSAGRTLRICAVATCASSSSRSSFDVDAIIRVGVDRNEADWLASALFRLLCRQGIATIDSWRYNIAPNERGHAWTSRSKAS